MNGMPLGRKVVQPKGHDPSVLYAIARKSCTTAFYGYDLWRCYELSWLNTKGKPLAGILEIVYPVQSACIVESKSLKLYLGGLSYEKFGSARELEQTIRGDLAQILAPEWISVDITVQDDFYLMGCLPHPEGECLDDLDTSFEMIKPNANILSCTDGIAEEAMYSDLLKTLCPITGQPDWATVAIRYRGRTIQPEALLRYLCSLRDCQGFAEEICERIFADITERCSPETLSVKCYYTRRGGIDINPFRCSYPAGPDAIERTRLIRQ